MELTHQISLQINNNTVPLVSLDKIDFNRKEISYFYKTFSDKWLQIAFTLQKKSSEANTFTAVAYALGEDCPGFMVNSKICTTGINNVDEIELGEISNFNKIRLSSPNIKQSLGPVQIDIVGLYDSSFSDSKVLSWLK